MNNIPTSPNTPVAELHRLFELQKANKQNVKESTASQRITKLKLFKKKLFEHRNGLQEAAFKDFRKPATEVDLTEIYPLVSEIRNVCSHLHDWVQDEQVGTPISMLGSASRIVHEPKGNCLLMAPWNYPIQITLQPLIAAVAAGNVVILKPSEYTPHVTSYLKKMLSEIFKEDEVAVVEGDHSVSGELLAMKFDHIHFTGSPAVGKVVMKAAAENLCSVTLELGGKSPVFVDESANISQAANRLSWGKFLNQGQTCIAPDYVLVHRSKLDALLSALKSNVVKQWGADAKNSPDVCRIVNAKHFQRLNRLLEEALAQGAKIEYGGERNEQDCFISPTILSNIPLQSALMKEEIFGPIMPIIPYDNIDEVLALVNSMEKPLSLYIFSSSEKNIKHIINHTSAGGTCINDNLIHIVQPNLPFGGVNNSGMGKSTGHFGFREFTNERAVLRQYSPLSTAQLMYPPYKNKLVKLVVELSLKFF
jgi:aldehyde dehydrogenase (NAD+)